MSSVVAVMPMEKMRTAMDVLSNSSSMVSKICR